jgi:Ca-activated chloride channel family protein
MNCLRLAFVRATFSSLTLLTFASDLRVNAQQTPQQAEPAAAAATLRPDADSVLLAVTVTDKKGNPVSGLDKSSFAIYENKVPQEITFFEGGDKPVSIGIIFDLSESLAGSKKLRAAHTAALRFIETSNSANDYFVLAFANRPLVLIDWMRDSKAVAETLSRYYFTAKSESKAPLNTALYDSCYLGIEKMRSAAHPRQAILLITDGQDNQSRYTFTEVRERLKQTGVLLYTVGISGTVDLGSTLGMEGQAAMNELSAVSGGKAFFPKSKEEIDWVFDRIVLDLRNQYLLGFKPSKEREDGKWHKIKIKVTPRPKTTGKTPGLDVRSREGYYAFKSLR